MTNKPNINKLKLVNFCEPNNPVSGAAANIPRNAPKKFSDCNVVF